QKVPNQSILDLFCSYLMVVLVALGSVATLGGALRDSNCHADSESWHPLFRARIRNGVCAWNHSHTLDCPATRDENGRTDGNADHARDHYPCSAVDSSASCCAVRGPRPAWDGVHRARPPARGRIRVQETQPIVFG